MMDSSVRPDQTDEAVTRQTSTEPEVRETEDAQVSESLAATEEAARWTHLRKLVDESWKRHEEAYRYLGR